VRVSDDVAQGVAFAPFHWGALHLPPASGALNHVLVRASIRSAGRQNSRRRRSPGWATGARADACAALSMPGSTRNLARAHGAPCVC
jgi:hypothetical protein